MADSTPSHSADMALAPQGLIEDVRSIILTARGNAIRSVDFHRVAMYWQIGQRIVEEEQDGVARAEYGAGLIDGLAESIEPEFGSGFSSRQLRYARQFYRVYPIWTAVRSELNWSQYRTLMAIDDPDKREYYELEAVHAGWTGRELERQVNSGLFERLLMSNDRAAVMEVARRDPTLTRDIDVVPTVQRAIDGVQEELAAKELRLSFDAPAAGMICAHDPTTLEHALIAMLVNAVEASPLGGQLHVEVASVEMPSGSEMMSESLCRISIRDHGRGFPVDHLERIFEFSFTTKQSGMGLGLALARQSLKRQGGNTGASNHPDGGAVVTIELPIRPSLADDVGLSTDIEPSTSIESVNMVRSDERM